jgi:hypothetical protein
MSNILEFPVQRPSGTFSASHALIDSFACRRHPMTDVLWFKENAELLGIFAACGKRLPPRSLSAYQHLYDGIETRLAFFPQYYRFLVSICLDLEDLGMPGDKGQRICDWVSKNNLPEAELSDLQRAEARRLLARRGMAKPVRSGALGERLRAFITRSDTFALPNRKAAYELTHIVFYLSEYGACDPCLSSDALRSLEFAGIVAYLDQDMDLLSEVCLALAFAGRTPSRIWRDAVLRRHKTAEVHSARTGASDAYHEYLVTGWASIFFDAKGFGTHTPRGKPCFVLPGTRQSALMPLSACLKDLGVHRSADWGRMRDHILPHLCRDTCAILRDAEESTAQFDHFFEGFARTSQV